MYLNDLLRAKNIDPHQVLVLRHRPSEPKLNLALPRLALEKPHVFNAYQQTQNERVEGSMTRAKYVASFIGQAPGKALFVGLYSVEGSRPVTRKQFWKIPGNLELKALGMKGFGQDSARTTVQCFDLVLNEFYADWKGRLIIGWPGQELSWFRLADRNEFPVLAILDESALDVAMPDWRELDLSWEELSSLPTRWKSKLSEWRGVYYIFDTSDGKGYVGAAYGANNILGRWLGYSTRGDGGNQLLRPRDPRHFQFTILQRVSPDMDEKDVIDLERTWKNRLHTRHPSGLNKN